MNVKARIFAEENKKWWTLAAVSFGLFMIMLDNTIVNVALPSIQRSLHMSLSSLEWIVTAYALTFAALLITGGKLGDLYGRRKMFMAGLVVFTLASLACGLATTQWFLVAARSVQGLGGAVASAVSLSLMMGLFTEPADRFNFLIAANAAAKSSVFNSGEKIWRARSGRLCASSTMRIAFSRSSRCPRAVPGSKT